MKSPQISLSPSDSRWETSEAWDHNSLGQARCSLHAGIKSMPPATLGLGDALVLGLLVGVLRSPGPDMLVPVRFGSISTKFIHQQLYQRLL